MATRRARAHVSISALGEAATEEREGVWVALLFREAAACRETCRFGCVLEVLEHLPKSQRNS